MQHTIDTPKYLKYLISSVEDIFTQPISPPINNMGLDVFSFTLSSNISGSGWNTLDGSQIFDSNNPTNQTGTWQASTPATLTIYNPYPLKLTNIKITNSTWYNANLGSAGYISSGYVQGSNNNSDWTTITNFNGSSSAEWNIDLSSNINYFKYYRVVSTASTGYQGKTYIARVLFSGTEIISGYTPATSNDFTLKKPQLHSVNTPKYIQNSLKALQHSVNIPKYLKKTTTSTTISLPPQGATTNDKYSSTSNTNYNMVFAPSLGGNVFAVQSSAIAQTGDTYPLWKAFQSTISSSSGFFYSAAGQGNLYMTFYNPEPIKVSKFTHTNAGTTGGGANGYTPATGTVYASNDNSTWTTITTFTNTYCNKGNVWDLTIPANAGYYKYWKIVPATCKYSNTYVDNARWQCAKMEITAIALTEAWTIGTTSNYDLIK